MDRTRASVVATILVFGVMSTRMASAQLSVVPINHLPSGNIILTSFDRARQARPVVQAAQSPAASAFAPDFLAPHHKRFRNVFASPSKAAKRGVLLPPLASTAKPSKQPSALNAQVICGMTIVRADPTTDSGMPHRARASAPDFLIGSIVPKVCR
jgi:hypothetical protein